MEGLVPRIVVLAFGAGALGGPVALRFLLAFAGRSPAIDIAICLLVISMLTAQLFGAVTLARFVRKACPDTGAGARRSPPGAPAVNIFESVTLMMSVCVGVLVTACLVVVPLVVSGVVGTVRILTVTLGVGGAAAAEAFTCTRPLLRVFRDAGNAGAAVPVARATGRSGTVIRTGWSVLAAGLVLAISFLAYGGHDAPRFFTGRNNMFVVGVAAVIGVCVPLLVCFPRSRGAGRATAPAPVAPHLRLPR